VASSLPVDASQTLNLRIISAVAPATYLLSGLVADWAGELTQFVQQVLTINLNTVVDLVVPLHTGTLLSLTLSTPTPSVARGNTWAQVWLQAGTKAGGTPLALLISDYVASGAVIGWPGGQLRGPLDTVGTGQSLESTAPGQSMIYWAVPPYQRWSFIAASVSCLSASIAPLYVQVQVSTGLGNSGVWVSSSYAQANGTTVLYQIAPGIPAGLQVAGFANIPVPEGIVLEPGWSFEVIDPNSGDSDSWDGWLQYEQVIDP